MKAEKAMAPHSSTLAWKIPWAEEPGELQSMGSLRARHDWATSLSLFPFMHWRRKWQPTPVFFLGESQGRWAAVYGVAQSWTCLKRCNSSSSNLQFRGLFVPISVRPVLRIAAAYVGMTKPLAVRITTNCGKFLKRWEYQTTLPVSWECMQVKK